MKNKRPYHRETSAPLLTNSWAEKDWSDKPSYIHTAKRRIPLRYATSGMPIIRDLSKLQKKYIRGLLHNSEENIKFLLEGNLPEWLYIVAETSYFCPGEEPTSQADIEPVLSIYYAPPIKADYALRVAYTPDFFIDWSYYRHAFRFFYAGVIYQVKTREFLKEEKKIK